MKSDDASRLAAEQERAVRLVTALADLQADGQYVFSTAELAKRAQVTPAVARLAVQDWFSRGWVRVYRATTNDTVLHVVTDKAPGAPTEAALSAVCLLQIIGNVRRLAYGYASALQYHDLTQLIISDVYVCEQDQTVMPPKYRSVPEPTAFKRSTKEPTVWGSWQGRRVYKLRRSAAMLKPQYRVLVPFQGVQLPCTTAARTLIDCWTRPDLAGGEDRVLDAWETYLQRRRDELPALGAEVAAILRDANWTAMTEAFLPWLRQAASHVLCDLVEARLAR